MGNKKYNILPPNAAVGLARVSTPVGATQGESIEVQSDAIHRAAAHLKANVHTIVEEPFSGRTGHRPGYAEALQIIKKHRRQVKYLIVRGIDRFTRAGVFEYERMKRELAKCGTRLVDSYGIIQPLQNTLAHLGFEYEWSKYSPSEISELMLAYQAQAEVRTSLTRMIEQEIRLEQQGYAVRRSPDGYVNRKIECDNGKRKTIREKDSTRGQFIITMFKTRACGAYTDPGIVEQLNAEGFRTPKFKRWDQTKTKFIGTGGGKPLTVKQLQRYIQNSIYCGVLVSKWTNRNPVRAQYPGLVSIDTFNRANRGKVYIKENGKELEILYNANPLKITKKRNKNNPLFPCKVILCPFCRKPFMASSPRGKSGKRFPTYHCNRGHKYFGCTKRTFESNVRKCLQSLRFTPEYFEKLERALIKKYHEQEKEIAGASARASQTVTEIEKEKSTISVVYVKCESETMRRELDRRMEELQHRIKAARNHRQEIEVTEDDIRECVKNAKELIEHPEKLLIDYENMEIRRAFWDLVFGGMPTYQEILNGTPKLSRIFTLSSDFKPSKFQLVTPRSLDWNTLEKLVLKWKYAFEMIETSPPLHGV